MKKKYIVKNERDFTRIIKTCKFKKNKSFVIYYEKNNLLYNRYGLSVGKKLGNAVFRNKYKRKIRSIIDYQEKNNNISIKKDYIIILREYGSKKEYNDLKEDLISLLETINKGEKNEI